MSDETDEYLYVYRVLVKEGVELIPIARERIGISKITETKFLYFEREIFFNGFQFFNIVRGGNRGGGVNFEIIHETTHVVTCIFDSKLNMFISIHTVKSTLTQAHKFEIYTEK